MVTHVRLMFCIMLGFIIITQANSDNVDSPTYDMKLATNHFSSMLRDAKCERPMPRVVHVSEMFPNARKQYAPHCTVIHFCGDDTGCCHENEQCVARHEETIELRFWVVELAADESKDGKKIIQRKGVEKLRFSNATECHCQRNNVKIVGPSSSAALDQE